ncbi:hypothetical protein H6G27_08040 [Nostoc linckia FACHB-104]|nr:hypothetical protein [Nostoc linckia FACHB-104]
MNRNEFCGSTGAGRLIGVRVGRDGLESRGGEIKLGRRMEDKEVKLLDK